MVIEDGDLLTITESLEEAGDEVTLTFFALLVLPEETREDDPDTEEGEDDCIDDVV
jgi:hypothetical protein